MATARRFTDLSIHLRAAWDRQHILNGGPKDTIVPGWFLRVTRNEGYDDVVAETPLSRLQTLQVALSVDSVLGHGAVVTTAVEHADAEMRDRLRAQLTAAEAAAARIPHLRRMLGEE